MHRITGLPSLGQVKQDFQHRVRKGKRPALVVLSPAELGDIPLDEGDNLLRDAQERLETVLRALEIEKEATIGQIGGRFIITVESGDDGGRIRQLINSICTCFNRPISLGSHIIVPTVHIGVSQPEDSNCRFDSAYHHATVAHITAVRRQYRHVSFSDELEQESVNLHATTTSIKQAVESGRVEVRYMEIRNLRTLEVHGYESLARISNPDSRRVIDAEEWIGVAEKTRLIVPLGEIANSQAIAGFNQQCRKTCYIEAESRRNFEPTQAYLALNFHSHQLREPGSASRLNRLIEQHGLNSQKIVVEVTESSSLLEDDILQVLDEIRQIGCQIYLDDFCKEYSSLSALDRLPLSGVKIDKVYLQRFSDNRLLAEKLLRAMVDIAEAVGIETIVAEGVETDEHIDFLQSIGIKYGQGHYFRNKLPA